jgi:hypothetical protein
MRARTAFLSVETEAEIANRNHFDRGSETSSEGTCDAFWRGGLLVGRP